MQSSMVKLLTLADIISLLNALFGFLAVIILFSTSFIHLSFSFLLLAILADGLDGMIARRKKSKLGENLDSLADIISMGVAPLLFAYNQYRDIEVFRIILIIGLLFYLISSIIRLSSFPILKRKNSFIGLPIPSASILIITTSYIHLPVTLLILFLFLSSLLMVSNIEFIKPDIRIDVISLIIITSAILLGWYTNRIPVIILFILNLVYILISPVILLKKSYRK